MGAGMFRRHREDDYYGKPAAAEKEAPEAAEEEAPAEIGEDEDDLDPVGEIDAADLDPLEVQEIPEDENAGD